MVQNTVRITYDIRPVSEVEYSAPLPDSAVYPGTDRPDTCGERGSVGIRLARSYRSDPK